MKAGRQLDFIIAEKIMGWIRVPIKDFTNINRFIYVKEDYILCTESWKNFMMNWKDPEEGMKLAKAPRIPDYSTDISAAWTVVEHINAIVIIKVYKSEIFVILEYGNENGLTHESKTKAETASHAICLAALENILHK